MNILITGANGFIGRNLKEYFEKQKTHKIYAPTEIDLDLTNSNVVEDFFLKNEINCIIHTATILQINKEYAPNVCEQNLKMFFNLYKYKTNHSSLTHI